MAGSVLIAGSEVASASVFDEPSLAAAALLTSGFGLTIAATDRALRSGRERWAVSILATSVFALGILSALLIPGSATASAMLPILSVVLLLPGRGRRSAGVVLAVALGGSCLALLLGTIGHPLPPLREPLGWIFTSATLLGVTVLILGALADSSIQNRVSLDRMERAMRVQAAAAAERTAIVASLGRLEPRKTIGATAQVFVDALMKLPDVDMAGIFARNGQDLEVLAITGPVGFPMACGENLPAPRARHLLDRMEAGPWAERWVDDPADGRFGEAFSAFGIKGQAYGPFYDRGDLVGFVAIATRSEVHAQHFMTDLPAVAEFAATASLLLAPLLADRRETTADRLVIESIIATVAYRPVFQPIVALSTGRRIGFEALTRFTDGRRPDLVFAAAAKVGAGFALELCTLDAAVRSAHDLPPGAWLSLNVSPSLLIEATGLAGVLAARDRPVVLEITEHVAIDDYGAVRSAIDRLGPDVRVAVDDAGSGIANFGHLAELRPHLLKVDSRYIRDLDSNLGHQAVVVGLVHFAARAGCDVVAEGIETEAERTAVLALGVPLGQGFLFARPAAVEVFHRSGPVDGTWPILPTRHDRAADPGSPLVPGRVGGPVPVVLVN
jgi:EAL domain-containing protein (putative c-di-GMP-specific phosphodiesterase class I)